MQHVLRFERNRKAQWGLLQSGRITPIPGEYSTTGSFVSAVDSARLASLPAPTLALADVRLLAPVTPSQQFVCQGANYVQHMLDSGMSPDDKRYNMIFTKAPSCIVPADHDLIRPKRVKLLDYEVELGPIIKQDITGPVHVHAANLHEFEQARSHERKELFGRIDALSAELVRRYRDGEADVDGLLAGD